MNAGVRERVNNSFNYKSIGDFVHELEVMDRTGKVKIFKRKDLNSSSVLYF